MRLITIESPFKPSDADVREYEGRYTPAELLNQNLIYARLALADSLRRGEAPLASHLLYTQVWGESDEERTAGIKAGLEWLHRADFMVLYIDLGISSGMRLAADSAKLYDIAQSRRMLFSCSTVCEVRERLAFRALEAFPYLGQLRAAELRDGLIAAATEGPVSVERMKAVREVLASTSEGDR